MSLLQIHELENVSHLPCEYLKYWAMSYNWRYPFFFVFFPQEMTGLSWTCPSKRGCMPENSMQRSAHPSLKHLKGPFETFQKCILKCYFFKLNPVLKHFAFGYVGMMREIMVDSPLALQLPDRSPVLGCCWVLTAPPHSPLGSLSQLDSTPTYLSFPALCFPLPSTSHLCDKKEKGSPKQSSRSMQPPLMLSVWCRGGCSVLKHPSREQLRNHMFVYPCL